MLGAGETRIEPKGAPHSEQRVGGNVAPILALLMGVLLLAIAGGLDLRDWLRARSQTRAAVDAGLIAGLRALQIDRLPRDDAALVAQQTYLGNLRKRAPMLTDSVSFAAADEDTAVEARGAVSLRPRLLQMLGAGSLTVVDYAAADTAKAIRTVGMNASQSLEIVLVVGLPSRLDHAAIDGIKAAVRTLADLVVWPLRQGHVSRLALVPFATGVNAGTLARLVSQPTWPLANFNLAGGLVARLRMSDCIGERTSGASALTDAPPYGSDQLSTVFTRTGLCEPAARVVLPTTDRVALDASIDALAAGGGAAGHVGLAWGWYLLSPSWAAALPFEAAPAAYAPSGTRLAAVRKVVIVIADGAFDTQMCAAAQSGGAAAGVLPDLASPAGQAPNGDCAAPNGPSSRQAAAICDAMKAAGVSLFTVTFPAGQQAADPALMARCATDAGASFSAATPADLLLAMRDIALKLTSLLVSR